MKVLVKGSYSERRKKEYPSIEEQLDALWKGGIDAENMSERVKEVKSKFPKEEV